MQLSHLFFVMLISYFTSSYAEPFSCDGCQSGPGKCCGKPKSGSIVTNTNCGSCPASSCPGSDLEKCDECSVTNKCETPLEYSSCTDKCWGYLTGKYLKLCLAK